MSNVFDRRVEPNGDSALPTEGQNDARPAGGSRVEDAAEGRRGVCTPAEVRETCQELLKYGHVEEGSKPEVFRRAVVYREQIAAALEPLDLELRLDTHRGVAFLAVATPSERQPQDDEQAWTHPLVRRQRLTLEQSLIVAILRQAFIAHEQEAGVGHSEAKIAVEDLLPHFLTYFEDSGSDAKNESRLLTLLDQLKTYGIVSEVDPKDELTIRPMIAHLANPESLAALLKLLREQTQTTSPPEQEP